MATLLLRLLPQQLLQVVAVVGAQLPLLQQLLPPHKVRDAPHESYRSYAPCQTLHLTAAVGLVIFTVNMQQDSPGHKVGQCVQ